MSENTNKILSRIAVAGLQKCVDRLTRVSVGTWGVVGADVSMGTLDEAIKRHTSDDGDSTVVYFNVKGELPFSAIMLVNARDVDRISRCMIGYSFSVAPDLTRTRDLFLSELGNILLNSFVGAISNALKRIFIPSVPVCLRGEPQYLLEAMGITEDIKQHYFIINVKLDIRCDKSVTRIELLGLIPEKLEQELLAIKSESLG
jgi:chemotaxis protein CheY-P-specific phosphatase CheC